METSTISNTPSIPESGRVVTPTTSTRVTPMAGSGSSSRSTLYKYEIEQRRPSHEWGEWSRNLRHITFPGELRNVQYMDLRLSFLAFLVWRGNYLYMKVSFSKISSSPWKGYVSCTKNVFPPFGRATFHVLTISPSPRNAKKIFWYMEHWLI